jgi:hypothetical protein
MASVIQLWGFARTVSRAVAAKSLSDKELRFVAEIGVPIGRAIRANFAREANCKQRVSPFMRVCWRAKCIELMLIVARTEKDLVPLSIVAECCHRCGAMVDG